MSARLRLRLAAPGGRRAGAMFLGHAYLGSRRLLQCPWAPATATITGRQLVTLARLPARLRTPSLPAFFSTSTPSVSSNSSNTATKAAGIPSSPVEATKGWRTEGWETEKEGKGEHKAKEEEKGPSEPTKPAEEALLSGKERTAFRVGEVLLGFGLGYLLYELYRYATEWPAGCEALVTQAAQHPFVQRHIGQPVRASFRWSGSARRDRCNVIIPISGPKGSGVLYGRNYRVPGKGWVAQLVQCSFDPSPQKISLMDNFANSCAPPLQLGQPGQANSSQQHARPSQSPLRPSA